VLEIGVRRLRADRHDRLADESERRLVVARTYRSHTLLRVSDDRKGTRMAQSGERRAASAAHAAGTWNALAGAKSAERAKASAAAYSLVTATGRPVLVSLGSHMLLAAAEPSSLPFILGPFHTTLYYNAMLKMKRITK
jgi:hypothetical protein